MAQHKTHQEYWSVSSYFSTPLSHSLSETAVVFTKNSKKVENMKGFLPSFFRCRVHCSCLWWCRVTISDEAWLASCWYCWKCFTFETAVTPLTIRNFRVDVATSPQGASKENWPRYLRRVLKHRRIKWCAEDHVENLWESRQLSQTLPSSSSVFLSLHQLSLQITSNHVTAQPFSATANYFLAIQKTTTKPEATG